MAGFGRFTREKRPEKRKYEKIKNKEIKNEFNNYG
jgi:hypothetical protein